MNTMRFRYVPLAASLLALVILLWLLEARLGSLPPLSLFLDAWHGAARTARKAQMPSMLRVSVRGLTSSQPLQIFRDERGVPHIFADNDADAAFALGYLTAADRLFQMDFQARTAAGRLSELLGDANNMVETDKYLRRTGMLWGAERTWSAIAQSNAPTKAIIEAFTQGANAYINTLSLADYPFEYRLLGTAPELWSPLKTILINQLMAFDLCFTTQTNDVRFAELVERLGAERFAELYPDHSSLPVPHNPEPKGVLQQRQQLPTHLSSATHQQHRSIPLQLPAPALMAWHQELTRLTALFGELVEGKGSNNWVVHGTRTATGKPILAGDPHLNLSIPSIWYEVHIVTPSSNIYGVTIPGAPLVIVGYNDYLAWSPTNTGADVLDFYTVTFDNERQQRYRYNGEWRTIREDVRPIRVKGKADVPDTVRFTHWGPVITQHKRTLAIRWMAHEPSTIINALWGFTHATTWQQFSAAQEDWDVPAQNIVVADCTGTIALRSCGVYPIRKKGHGKFIHNGETDEGEWIGRIPFDSLPASVNPKRGWLQSANQEPTPPDYPYYLNYNWPNSLRGARIAEVLTSNERLTLHDAQMLQVDVEAQQFRQLKRLLQSCGALASVQAPAQKHAIERLLRWDGVTSKESTETLLFKLFWDEFIRLTWDELPDSLASGATPMPSADVLLFLAQNNPQSQWFDRLKTPERETALEICSLALQAAADSLIVRYGSQPENWAWGNHHSLIIRHTLRSTALKPLWRGPFPFQGFSSTVLPASGMQTTHSASWRMIVDFGAQQTQQHTQHDVGGAGSTQQRNRSSSRITGYAVYPGGPSGNPFSPLYDSQIQSWLDGKLFLLYKPTSLEDFEPTRLRQTLILTPSLR